MADRDGSLHAGARTERKGDDVGVVNGDDQSSSRSMGATGSAPELVVVCGLPGVGKTTVAETITDRTDGELFRTDVVRKELFPEPEYTAEESQVVYEELFRRGTEALARGSAAVFDGTFTDRSRRENALAVADEVGVDWTLVNVQCDTTVVERRIECRENDVSDADFDVHLMYRDRFEPIDRDHVTVDNSDGLDETYRQIETYF